MKNYIFTILFSFISFINFSSHLLGGHITYYSTGIINEYKVVITVYQDCPGWNPSSTIDLNYFNTCDSILNTLYADFESITEVSQLCQSQIGNSQCNGGALRGVKEYKYAAIVTLSPLCDFWRLDYGYNSRYVSENVDLTSLYSMRLETTINTVNSPDNNSPQLNAIPIPYACLNIPFSYDLEINQPYGDSLVYSIVSPLAFLNTPISFLPGYSSSQPIPGITIDSSTGQINFTPTLTGAFAMAILIEEYKNGILVGTITHDFQVIVENCSNSQPNVPIEFDSFNNNGTNSTYDSLTNTISMCSGDSFQCSIVFDDIDILDSLSISSNINTVLPGATLDYTGSNPVIATINWNQTPIIENTISFYIKDNACPVFGISLYSFQIETSAPLNLTETMDICENQSTQINSGGQDSLIWSVLNGPPLNIGNNFSCNNCSNPIASPESSTTYLLEEYSNCYQVDSLTLNVFQNMGNMVNDIGLNDTSICPNSCIEFNNSAYLNEEAESYILYNASSDFLVPIDSTVASSVFVVTTGVLDSNMLIKTICLDINCNSVQNLDVFIISPLGSSFELSTSNGSLGSNYTNTCFVNSDITAIDINSYFAYAPFSGSFYPEGGELENAFIGESVQGIWKIKVINNGTVDFAIIENWSIEFTQSNIVPQMPESFTWSNTDGLDSTLISPSICPDTSGVYILTIYDENNCYLSDSVSISVSDYISAGDDSVVTVNVYSGLNNLNDYISLNSTQNGIWTDSLIQNLNTSIFNPDTLSSEETYFYIVQNNSGCTDTSNLIVLVDGYCDTPPVPPNPNILALPNAGIDNSVTINLSIGQIDLFSNLLGNPDPNGFWYEGSNTLFNGIVYFNSSIFTETFYYVVESEHGCLDTAYITLTVQDDLSTDKLNSEIEITFYPNPFSNSLSIESELLITRIEIVDIYGRIVFSRIINSNNETIFLEELSQGSYIIKTYGDKLLKTQLIIKE